MRVSVGPFDAKANKEICNGLVSQPFEFLHQFYLLQHSFLIHEGEGKLMQQIIYFALQITINNM